MFSMLYNGAKNNNILSLHCGTSTWALTLSCAKNVLSYARAVSAIHPAEVMNSARRFMNIGSVCVQLFSAMGMEPNVGS